MPFSSSAVQHTFSLAPNARLPFLHPFHFFTSFFSVHLFFLVSFFSLPFSPLHIAVVFGCFTTVCHVRTYPQLGGQHTAQHTHPPTSFCEFFMGLSCDWGESLCAVLHLPNVSFNSLFGLRVSGETAHTQLFQCDGSVLLSTAEGYSICSLICHRQIK